MTKSHLLKYAGFATACYLFVLLAWITFELITNSSKGLDLTDESFYILSYLTRDEVGRSFTGATWIIGLLYDLLGQDITRLRIARIFVLISTGAYFGKCLLDFIMNHLGKRTTGFKHDLTGWKFSIIFGASIASLHGFTWAPRSFGYNDLSFTLTILIAAISIKLISVPDNSQERKISISYIVIGFLWSALIFTKVTTGALIAIIVLPVIVKTALNFKQGLRQIFDIGCGALLFWLISILYIKNVFHVVPESLKLLNIISAESYKLSSLIEMYLTHLKGSAELLLKNYWYAFFAVMISSLLSELIKPFRHGLLLVGLVIVNLVALGTVLLKFPLSGGTGPAVFEMQNFVFLFVLLAFVHFLSIVVARLFVHRNSLKIDMTSIRVKLKALTQNRLVLVSVILLTIPLIIAFGTDNPILINATFASVAWVSFLVISIVTTKLPYFRYVFTSACVCIVTVIAFSAFDGFVNHPYRIIGDASRQTESIDAKNVEGIFFEDSTARYLRDLKEIFAQNDIPPKTTIIGLDRMPGEILVLDGISPGETWYSRRTPERNAHNISYSCNEGMISAQEQFVVLTPSGFHEFVITALKDCGIDIDDLVYMDETQNPRLDTPTKLYLYTP